MAETAGRSRNISLARTDRLRQQLAAALADMDEAGTQLDVWAGRLADPFNTTRDAMRACLVWIVSHRDPTARDRAVRRVAGNPDSLAEGRPPLESTQTDTAGWGVIQVIAVDTVLRFDFKTKKKHRVCELRVRALSGPACPDIFTQSMSAGLLRYIGRQIGFTRNKGKRPLLDDRELSGLRALAYFQPSEGRTKMVKYALNSVVRQWNVSILTDRSRASPTGHQCPRNYPQSVLCFQCSAGRDECRVATRPRSLVQRMCTGCGDAAWFDPAKPDARKCISCSAREDKQ